jgi:hypothetical protein
MSDDLEFHYVVSYRQGIGRSIAVDTEDALFNEGTIYDWENDSWDVEIDEVDTIDLEHYRMLNSALLLLNEGAINA